MENEYLIPANSKKSMLILGFFTPVDLIIFVLGILFSIVMLVSISTSDLKTMLIILCPALISAFLVLPVPHYHNVLQLITNIYNFLFGQRRYYWKGWSVTNEESRK